MHVEEAFATWYFSIILISLKVEVAQISDFLVHAKILPLSKAFFNLNLPHPALGKKDIARIFLYLTSHALFRSSSISANCWGTLQIFSSQCLNSLVFAARQIANNLSPIPKQF